MSAMTTIDDPRTALLQSLLAGGEGSPSPQDLLAQLGASDPTTALVLQYLAQQRASAPAPEEPDEDESELEAGETAARDIDAEHHARAAAALRDLRRRVAALYAELEELRVRNEDLAAALGACTRCWGDDPECPICEGCGRPGGAPPDPYLYARLIAPAVRRLKHWDPADGRPTGAAPRTVGTASTR